jgi:hypothetical protein
MASAGNKNASPAAGRRTGRRSDDPLVVGGAKRG